MTSTPELIAGIPGYMVGIVSARIMGRSVDARTLSEWLGESARLKQIIAGLSERERSLLQDIHDLGGHMDWHVLLRAYRNDIAPTRGLLDKLGQLGLVFQAGLSGRDPVVLLPSLAPVMDELRERGMPEADALAWKAPQPVSIWPHIVMLNALKAVKIRCRPGMEPFKKGWELLEERLGAFIDVRRIYWELEVLGCVREVKGTIEVLPGPSQGIAMDGELRYRIWRFIQSCRPYQGLDSKVFAACSAKGLARESLQRAIFFYLAHHLPEMDAMEHVPSALTSLWLELGILQEDHSGTWVRFSEDIAQALGTGEIKPQLTAYRDEVIIQPNMEILVPQDFDPLDHLNIGEVADLVQADVVSIYRLSRASVFRAVRDGWSGNKLANFLDRIAKHAVPENVLKTLSGWVSSLTQAHIIRGTFLVMENNRDKLPHGLEEVLPGIYRVPERCEDDIVAFLDRKSVIVQHPGQELTDEEETDWGRGLPLKPPAPESSKPILKEGVYPFGMVMPLPYGHKGVDIFEQMAATGQSLIIFYPKHGYGETQVYKILPDSVFTKGGISFVEAMNEDTGENEVFDITKVRALLRQTAEGEHCINGGGPAGAP